MAKGGSRNGAGRPAYRVKGEQLMQLDIRAIHQRGLLWVGGTNDWNWSRGDEHVGNVRFTVRADSILLAYSVNGQDASQTIATTTTSCAFGGSRRWFHCPACQGRVALIYMRANRFACRRCQRVSYSTQSGSESTRDLALYHRLNALIEAGKPKWQRWATFHRLEDRFNHVDGRVCQSLILLVNRLTKSKPINMFH